jgi:hypothetical protein
MGSRIVRALEEMAFADPVLSLKLLGGGGLKNGAHSMHSACTLRRLGNHAAPNAVECSLVSKNSACFRSLPPRA